MTWSDETFTLTDEQSGVAHRVSVATPFRYDSLDSAPLILCLDGAWVAGTVRDATRIMSMGGEAPEAIVVGLSFSDESMTDYLRSRARWFCPTPWVPPEIVGVKGTVASEFGQAATYLDFIRDQVLPRIEAEYRVSHRALVGHSFSGLFGLRTLLTEPHLFDRYLLASPSIWWDGRAIFDFEDAYAAEHDDLAARVFLSVGEGEKEFGSEFNMAGNVVEMIERLTGRGYASLSVEHQTLPTESHNSTIGAAVSRGLRSLFS